MRQHKVTHACPHMRVSCHAGADIDLVKARGRWTSDAWKIYVSTAERSIGGAQWAKNKDKEWAMLINQ